MNIDTILSEFEKYDFIDRERKPEEKERTDETDEDYETTAHDLIHIFRNAGIQLKNNELKFRELKDFNEIVKLSADEYAAFYLLFELRSKDEPKTLTQVYIHYTNGDIWVLNTPNHYDVTPDNLYKAHVLLKLIGFIDDEEGKKVSYGERIEDENISLILPYHELHNISLIRTAIKNYIYETITKSTTTSIPSTSNSRRLYGSYRFDPSNKNDHPNRVLEDENQRQINYKRLRESISEERMTVDDDDDDDNYIKIMKKNKSRKIPRRHSFYE